MYPFALRKRESPSFFTISCKKVDLERETFRFFFPGFEQLTTTVEVLFEKGKRKTKSVSFFVFPSLQRSLSPREACFFENKTARNGSTDRFSRPIPFKGRGSVSRSRNQKPKNTPTTKPQKNYPSFFFVFVLFLFFCFF